MHCNGELPLNVMTYKVNQKYRLKGALIHTVIIRNP